MKYLENSVSGEPSNVNVLRPENACSDVTYTALSKIIPTTKVFIWETCVEPMQKMVLKVWCRYCDAFVSYGQYSGGRGVA